ncbi:MAG: hypothetical protein WBP45_07190 [Daejeonella sp.]
MKKLNLEQLHAEFDVINEAESNSIKGGDWLVDFYNSHGSGTYSGSQVMEWGNDYYGDGGYGGGDWWQGNGNPCNPIQLNEVVISSGSSDIAYFDFAWSGTTNRLVYAFEALYNGFVLLGNGGVWVWNNSNDLWDVHGEPYGGY